MSENFMKQINKKKDIKFQRTIIGDESLQLTFL